MNRRILFAWAVALIASSAGAQFSADVSRARTAEDQAATADQAARQFATNLAGATAKSRMEMARTGHFHPNFPVSFPATIWLTSNGQRLPITHPLFGRIVGLNLVFDSSGSRAFPAAYQAKLQAIFASAQATMNNVFGPPAVSGNVAVKDYNADISDRGFFSGGFYIPNGGSGPEIHFPEYSDGTTNDATTAINFIHVLLLAYLGPDQYGFDAFSEGLVRAATMKVARTPAALPGYLQSDVDSVLENTYDVGPWYDWYNQRALGGSQFVAANLANQPLNNGVGGLWMLRYRMAGAAWEKMLAEHPTFISTFNAGFYANAGIAGNVPALETLGQTTLNTISGGNPTVEGYSFSDWFTRQFILETKTTSGHKILVQPIPVTSGFQTGDYGPFEIQTNYFQTVTGGDEALSDANSFPIVWQGDLNFTRVFLDAQNEAMTITGAFGSILPNLPDLNGGVPYRATVDVPVGDQMGRAYLPVGSIATASNPTPSDFYGTVTGVFLQNGDSMRLQVKVGNSPIPDVPVTPDGAFGEIIGTQTYLDYNTITVSVVRTHLGADSTLLTRIVDKGPGALALDLRVGSDVAYQFPFDLAKGVSTIGWPVDPWLSYNPDIVGPTTLIARYDPSIGRYNLFPDAEAFKIGLGFFLRSDTTQTPFIVNGRIYKNISGTVSLRPGWNLVSSPLAETSSLSNVQSVHSTDFPRAFTDAEGSDIGLVYFQFLPGQNDPVTGAPEQGSMIPASQFQEGVAYYVLALAPEGVSLVFSPQGGTTSRPASIQHALTPPPLSWLMGVTLIDGGFSVGAQIGESTTATHGFDRHEDAELPPALAGGRQVTVTDNGSMYRDVRALGRAEIYTVQIVGLKAGRRYSLSFNHVVNSPGIFNLYRSDGSMLGRFQPGQLIGFTATGPTMNYKIKVSGGMSR